MSEIREFLENGLRYIFNDFQTEIRRFETLCPLKDLRFNSGNIPNYEINAIQQLYLLRYFPAYTIEYYRIYTKLIQQGFIDQYNVLSIGAGSGLDYYGLYFALNKDLNYINYTGLDRVNWLYRDNLGNNRYDFIHDDISAWDELDWHRYNVIMFPKSIGEFDSETFDRLLDIINNSTFENDKISLISSIRELNDSTDIARLVRILEVLENSHGFNCLDDATTSYSYGKVDGFVKYYPKFEYPQDILNFITNLLSNCQNYRINGKPCETSCFSFLNKWPVLKDGHVKYQIVRLER